MDLSLWSLLETQVVAFSLLFARSLGLLFGAPLISFGAVSFATRTILALMLSLVLWPAISQSQELSFFAYQIEYVAYLVIEVFIGLGLGFGISLIFAILQGVAPFVVLPMGLSAAQIFDPNSGEENNVLTQFFFVASVLMFLEIGGFRQLFLVGLYESFTAFNVGQLVASYEGVYAFLERLFVQFFYYSLVLSLPLMFVLLLISVSMGFLSKAAPQINLLIVGFPITLLVGFLLLFLLMPILLNRYAMYLSQFFFDLRDLYQSIRGLRP